LLTAGNLEGGIGVMRQKGRIFQVSGVLGLATGVFIACVGLAPFSMAAQHTSYNRKAAQAAGVTEPLPPEGQIGKRLFLETRFAQFFAANCNGNVNAALASGDPVVATIQTPSGNYPSPIAGQSINCRFCHIDNELAGTALATRAYNDYLQREPIPARGGMGGTTLRNVHAMADSMISGTHGIFLHADGQFASGFTAAQAGLTGRGFGWLPSEYNQAVAWVATVIRQDDGTGSLAQQYGGSYARILLGTDPTIPPQFQLSAPYRLDVTTATDDEILNDLAQMISTYLESFVFARDIYGQHNGSPYDMFLSINNLPQLPNYGESDADYSKRLLAAVNALQNPIYVTSGMGSFVYQKQQWVFGAQELQGMKVFLKQTTASNSSQTKLSRTNGHLRLLLTSLFTGVVLLAGGGIRSRKTAAAVVSIAGLAFCFVWGCGGGSSTVAQTVTKAAVTHTGNCMICHPAPDFTDHSFHNNGASQEEYDAVHGQGTFASLAVPGYEDRQANYDEYLPATPQHPNASGPFEFPPSPTDPGKADLGMWNIYANDDFPEPQSQLQSVMCASGAACDPATVLPNTLALFRTPTIRDLGQTDPYLHTGRKAAIEDVIQFYRDMAALQSAGKLRNGDPAIGGISIDDTDAAALAAFLRSLNEDFV
jgi:hypothetical protein